MIDVEEVEFMAIRAQGAGGQNVNKVSSAIHLRFDIVHSKLPEEVKERLLNLNDKRLTKHGEIIIKAQRFRTQEKNKVDALARLNELITSVATTAQERKPTKPSKSVKRKRLENKANRSQTKALRTKVSF